jgi:hypothetical protein
MQGQAWNILLTLAGVMLCLLGLGLALFQGQTALGWFVMICGVGALLLERRCW